MCSNILKPFETNNQPFMLQYFAHLGSDLGMPGIAGQSQPKIKVTVGPRSRCHFCHKGLSEGDAVQKQMAVGQVGLAVPSGV